jgi:alkanesulfonate monooxygenase SsuD/methylene tetrahydromethanopterin reductase-like flavin-dependent oxidoreductase (luciferase family)
MGEGIEAIRRHAREAGREIPEDHYGVLVPYFFARDFDEALTRAGASAARRKDISVESYAALGSAAAIRHKIQAYIDVGATKFVMRPCGPVDSTTRQVEMLAQEVIPALQTPFSETERQDRLSGWAR